jgi:hypothetical protein
MLREALRWIICRKMQDWLVGPVETGKISLARRQKYGGAGLFSRSESCAQTAPDNCCNTRDVEPHRLVVIVRGIFFQGRMGSVICKTQQHNADRENGQTDYPIHFHVRFPAT